MYKGSCLCGAVTYQLITEPVKVTHCHCTQCQKQHGAAFATYASLHKNDLVYLTGHDSLVSYNSSSTVERKFCRQCGSSIEWSGHPDFADWASIAIATLDTPFHPKEPIKSIYLDDKACWLTGFGSEEQK